MTGKVKFNLDSEQYFLTERQAEEVDAADTKFPAGVEGDRDFNAWFRNYARTNKIHAVNRHMSRYWAGNQETISPEIKLATVLKAQKSILRVMDPEETLQVEYSAEGDVTSSWSGSKVSIPSSQVYGAATVEEAINITAGFTAHEGCHAKHTPHVNGVEVIKFRKASPVNAAIANLLEDVRIEREESKENPGFNKYMDKTRGYMWDRESHLMPKGFADADELRKQLALVSAYTAYSDYATVPAEDSEIAAAMKSISDEYGSLSDEEVTPEHLIQSVKSIKRLVDWVPSKGGDDEMPPLAPCSAKGDAVLDDETANAVDNLVASDVEIIKEEDSDPKPPNGDKAPLMASYRPRTVVNRKVVKAHGMMHKVQAALQFRKAVPRADERLRLSGELDEDDLYRLISGDMRVFRDISEEVIPAASVTLLVDVSGSMSGYTLGRGSGVGRSKIQDAHEIATVFLNALNSKPNVKVRVLAHTSDTNNHTGAGFFRVWETGDPINRINLLKEIQRGENYDSYAILWAGKQMIQDDAEQKVLIVLSDGMPAGDYYGGIDAMLHVKSVVNHLQRKGIQTIQFSMDTDLDKNSQAMMFNHYIPAAGGNQLLPNIVNKLQRILEKFV